MKNLLSVGAQTISVLAALAGLAVVVWVLVSGLAGREGLDAMFLLIVGLAFAVMFGVAPARAILRRDRKSSAQGRKAEVQHDRPASA